MTFLSPVATPLPEHTTIRPITPASVPDVPAISKTWLQMDGIVGIAVSVRGVVVNYHAGEMGNHRIHRREGGGDPFVGNLDLTVTSLYATSIGDTIADTGVVRRKPAAGAGYLSGLPRQDAPAARHRLWRCTDASANLDQATCCVAS